MNNRRLNFVPQFLHTGVGGRQRSQVHVIGPSTARATSYRT
jgi:hypothetical protein